MKENEYHKKTELEIKQKEDNPFLAPFDVEGFRKDELPFDEQIEVFRAKINKKRKVASFLSALSMCLVVGCGVAAFIFFGLKQEVLTIIFGVLAVVILISFTIVNKFLAKPDVKGYTIDVCKILDRFYFQNSSYSKVVYFPTKNLKIEDILYDGIFANIGNLKTRNFVEGTFEGHKFVSSEVAIFNNLRGKQQKPLFIGKYLKMDNNLHFLDRFVITIDSPTPVDSLTGINDLSLYKEDGLLKIYGPKGQNIDNVFSKSFLKKIKQIQLDSLLLKLTIVVWANKTMAYLSYSDEIVTLPYFNKVNVAAQEKNKDDTLQVLSAMAELGK